MGNKEWRVGDSVLCVKSNNELAVIEGHEYIIDGFSCCPRCGEPALLLEGKTAHVATYHDYCGLRGSMGRQRYSTWRFIRPDLSSLTEYRNQVSVREIPSELKKLEPLQNQ